MSVGGLLWRGVWNLTLGPLTRALPVRSDDWVFSMAEWVRLRDAGCRCGEQVMVLRHLDGHISCEHCGASEG